MVVRDHSWKIRYTIGEGEARTIFKELKRGEWMQNDRIPVNDNAEQMGWVRITTYVPGKELALKFRDVLLAIRGDVDRAAAGTVQTSRDTSDGDSAV
ncbi:hypothetical protein [Calditerricola satsumensis]|nr:hypothetical protein [Calditerricola satsumensis]